MKTKSSVPQPKEFSKGTCGQLLRTSCWPFPPTTTRPCANVASLHTRLSHIKSLCAGFLDKRPCVGAGGRAPPCRSAPSPSDPEELPHSSSTHRLPPAAQHTVKSHMYPLSPEQTLCASQISVAMKPSLPTWGGSEANTARSSTATRTQGLVGKAALLPRLLLLKGVRHWIPEFL